MTTVIETIAQLLNRRGRYVLSQLDGLTEAQLNQPLALPETNTLYQLVTHMTSSGEFWVLTMVGGRSTTRDRGAEWQSTGTLSDLQIRANAVQDAMQEVLAGLSSADLERQAVPPTDFEPEPFFVETHGTEPLTVGYCLVTYLHHSALHLGHLQLTRQLLVETAS